MQAITLEVIIRAVFRVNDAERVEHVASRLRPCWKITSEPRGFYIAELLGPERGVKLASLGLSGVPQAVARVHEAIDQEVAERRREANLDEREDILSMLMAGTRRGRRAAEHEQLRTSS